MEPIVFSHKVKINDFSVKCLFKLSERENKSLYVNSKSLSSTSFFKMNITNCSYQPTNNTEKIWLNNFNNILNANNLNPEGRCLSKDLKNVSYDDVNKKSTLSFQVGDGTRKSFFGFSKIE
jgi:hypothetical protein